MASSFAAHHASPDAAELEVRRSRQLGERAPASVGPVALRSRHPANPAELILGLQQTAGNAAVAQLMRASTSRPVPVARPIVQRSGDDEASTDGEQGGDEQSVEAGEPLPTPIAGSEAAGSAAGGDSADRAGDAATDGAQTEGAATGAQAGAGPDPADAAPTDAGDTATGAAESTGADQGETATAGGESAGTSDSATGDAGDAAAAEGGEAASGDGEAADGEHSQEDQDKKSAEGEGVTGEDERVEMAGGPPPVAPVATGRFIDGGRRATVPFGSAMPSDLDPAETLFPHAYTGGGRTGGAAWAGGGKGKGPKGNQGTGSLQTETEPKYDTRSNGLTGNADAWVKEGTGVVDVKRDYITSDAGDQGNGWWISAKAAASLEAHEQRHIASSKEVYENKLQPMQERVANSAALGKGLAYWASDAISILQRKIGWKYALDQFKESDTQSNSDQGLVDLGDYGTSHYPRNMQGPRKIAGKDYENFLIMGDEPDPT